ncbi:endoplasmic reticulum metallopeptidase 1-like isoform X1 [Polypterus senegalus]|uniref:endoplasmic reticulum metallopeptidase 1-like isoform X1 n=2 Tax=Polypterus senegalus TaxID=55291 RepID=UPI0019636C49|nr:endoplasmic reticulum metallopeptidase 1-like isoform X1 [Polypterus senegalus]
MENDTTVRRIRGAAVDPGVDGDSRSQEDEDHRPRRNGPWSIQRRSERLLEESSVMACLLVFLFILWCLIQFSVRQLIVGSSTGEFNAGRARKHLETITAFGPRPVGSPQNEISTVNYLLSQIEMIKDKSKQNVHTITVDVQKPTGSFSIDFLGGFTSYYDKVTNVAVKLEPQGGAKHALLANCHFDSVANSPGACDDAVSCSIMLEVLHSLSNLSIPLKHSIIFLFNGAEENILQASHGFITQHPWAKLVRAFINLEAAGVGGKEIVFQTGPENPWLVQAYVRAAKHPFASVIGQEVFQSGIIPSDTDFRIYRDFGHIPGIDLAFIENGYIYHTKYDTPDRILTESIQRAGENILAVLKLLATTNELSDSAQYQHGNVVFFDLLGFFMVAYPARVGTIINSIVAMVTLIYLGKKMLLPNGGKYMHDLLYGIGITVAGWFITLISVLIVAVFISLIGRAMFWYHHFYTSILLYGSVCVAKLLLVHTLAKNLFYGKVSPFFLGELHFDVSLTLWCCALILLTQQGLCSAYVPMLMVAFPLLTKLFLQKELKQQGATVKYTVLYLLGLSLPYVHFMFLIWALFEIFCPILGRSGTEIPPDIVLASLIAGCTIILSSYFIHFIYLCKSTKKTLLGLVSIFVLMGVLVSCGLFFPYSSDPGSPRPKRIFLQHTTRTFHDLDGNVIKKDSGVWINGFDYTGINYVTPHINEINENIRTKCDNELPYCGFPWFLPVKFLVKKNWYLPGPEVQPKNPPQFTLVSRHETEWGTTNLTFQATGPSHMSIYFLTRNGAKLISWSFGDGSPEFNLDGEYFIFYSHGLDYSAWNFWLEIQGPHTDSVEGIISVGVASHYFHGGEQNTEVLESLLLRFPDWSFPSHWVSTYHLFEY